MKQINNQRKPSWLRVGLGNNRDFTALGKIIRTNRLRTICESGRCPNKGECWNNRTATFLIAGEICTRNCGFCHTFSGYPLPLDEQEPFRIAESVKSLDLKHVVITSVCRDDLFDYGASHWEKTLLALKKINPHLTIEALIPDFRGNRELINRVIRIRPDIVSHNIETVRRLTPRMRSAADYTTSLKVLQKIAEIGIIPKSGLMVGLGESKREVIETMQDLFAVGCRFLSIGQYLQPSCCHFPVQEYLPPNQFQEYKALALSMNFKHVESGPLVRSSYYSADLLSK